MIVISLSACPSKVKGYLTEWFIEIATGVYVGNVTSRVRDEIWNTITDSIGSGCVIMAYSANNEQGMDFKTWNTGFVPVDYDGIQLVRQIHRKQKMESVQKSELPVYYGLEYYQQKRNITPVSKERKQKLKANHSRLRRKENDIVFPTADYTVIDLETCGLKPESAPIIELGAVKVKNHQVVGRFQRLIRIDSLLSEEITQLTGITNDLLKEQGVFAENALKAFFEFIGDDVIAGHNVKFDIGFLQYACRQYNMSDFSPTFFDSWILSKHLQPGLPSYRLSALLKFFNIAEDQCHRSLQDAELTYRLIEKLNEKR